MSDFNEESMQRHPFANITLPLNWRLVTLEDISVDVSPGFASGKHNSDGTGIPHLRPMNVGRDGQIDLNVVKSVTESNGIELQAGDVLFNNTNSAELVGKTSVISSRETGFAFSNHMTRIRPACGVTPAFAARQLHFLWMSGYMKHRCTNHVNQASISSKTLAKTIPLFLPPSAEQTRIVAKLEELLSDLDAGVAELKAAQKKLAQYRQSLLKAAVDGSLTAEWRKSNPPTETGAQLLERILKERRARWEEKQLTKFKEQGKTPPKDWQKKYPEPVLPNTTDLSALPTSWAWASVDQSTAESLIGLDRGQEQQSSSAAFGYIKMNNVSMNGHVDVKNITRVNATQEEVDKYAVALNDVLFNTRNSLELVGKTGLVSDLDGVTLYNNNLMRLRFDGVLKPAFACFQMCGPEFRARLERVKKATTSVAAVYAKDLFPLAIAVPPIAEQTEILRILDLAMAAIDAQQLSIERSFKQAAAQRQNILRAAFAGQLVPQDPNDEPASVLLERIRAERASHSDVKKSRRRKTKETSNA